MGLDAVEVVMEVEEHFGISIQDAEAEHVRTVGDLVKLIRGRIAAARSMSCPALPAFLKLRRAVRDATGSESVRIQPRDRVASVLSAAQRRSLWKELRVLMGTAPRPLRRPAGLRRALVAISIGLVLAGLALSLAIDIRTWPLMVIVAGVAVYLLHLITAPFRTVPPDDWTTFGEVTRKLMGVRVATKHLHLQSEDEILSELRPLLVCALGVDHATIVPSARFVEDLGLN